MLSHTAQNIETTFLICCNSESEYKYMCNVGSICVPFTLILLCCHHIEKTLKFLYNNVNNNN